MVVVSVLFYLLLVVFAVFAIFPALLNLISLLVTYRKKRVSEDQKDIACIITGYKNLDITVNLVESLLAQQYPNFHVYLVADHFEALVYPVLSNKLSYLRPQPFLSSKSKSIKYAIDHFVRPHSHVVIFDPDNLVKPDFLGFINARLQEGYDVVQGRRTAKNLDTTYACLDAMSEFYYNHTQRKVPFVLGGSATIAGSGMCVKADLYTAFFAQENIDRHIIAEDKLMQIYMVDQQGQRLAYAESAVVYDEKVSTGEQVQRQRTRWITSFFQYFGTGFGLFLKGLFTFKYNKALFGFTIIIPPLFILILLTGLLVLLSLFMGTKVFVGVLMLVALFVCHFFISLYASGAPNKVVKAVLFAPFFVARQVLAMTQFRKTKSDFLVTEKTVSKSIDEVTGGK
ncbi:MAG TPA: glycosyltransferase [Cytophagales bacterium]|nr:glycosyltransferase [Cytophagales bacterium]